MIVDSSALVKVVLRQQGWEAHAAAIKRASALAMSAVNLYETAVVLSRNKNSTQSTEELWSFVESRNVEVVPFDKNSARGAAMAYQKYGKGIHPAGLNLGDCPAYALASSRNLPLLFEGRDFARTDIRSALE